MNPHDKIHSAEIDLNIIKILFLPTLSMSFQPISEPINPSMLDIATKVPTSPASRPIL